MEGIDKDQINVRSDSEWAKKEAKRDRRTAYACKLADLESSQLSRHQKEGTEGGVAERKKRKRNHAATLA